MAAGPPRQQYEVRVEAVATFDFEASDAEAVEALAQRLVPEDWAVVEIGAYEAVEGES